MEGRPNFITIAHVGVLTVGEPECISFGINKNHYTNQGIKDNQAFSVNLPSEDMVAAVDYCGLVSGKNTDKSQVFEIFYGELAAAPMIAQCPVTMECRLHQVVDFPRHEIFIGEIIETHAEESVLKGGKPDIAKIKPCLFDMHSKRYWRLGSDFAGCWKEGLKLKRLLEK